MHYIAPGEGEVRNERHFALKTQELKIEVLQRARMPQDCPAHRDCHEANHCLPFAFFVTIGQTKPCLRIAIGDRRSTDGPRFSHRSIGQVDSQTWCQVGREKGVVGTRVDVLASRRRDPEGPPIWIGTRGRWRT